MWHGPSWEKELTWSNSTRNEFKSNYSMMRFENQYTLMPAAWHLATASGTPGRHGSLIPTMAIQIRSKSGNPEALILSGVKVKVSSNEISRNPKHKVRNAEFAKLLMIIFSSSRCGHPLSTHKTCWCRQTTKEFSLKYIFSNHTQQSWDFSIDCLKVAIAFLGWVYIWVRLQETWIPKHSLKDYTFWLKIDILN